MKAETVICSVLLALEALLAFQLPGTPVAGPAVGIFVILFFATLAAARDTAARLRHLYAFFLFLVTAAANKGSYGQVALAVATGIHFFTWTEGFTGHRRYAIKKGEPLPPDGRRGVYSLAFCAALVVSYLFLDGAQMRLPAAGRSVLAFVALACGFCLWDVGYVTRLQRATRFRRPAIPAGIRAMQALVVAAIAATLFLIFGRAIPTSAEAIHRAAAEFRKDTPPLGGEPLRADRDRVAEPGHWQTAGGSWMHPHKLPADGDFHADQGLLLAMSVPDPAQRDRLIGSRVYVRGYSLDTFAGDEWLEPGQASVLRLDAQDGGKDGRVQLGSTPADDGTAPVVHALRLLEPFQGVLPALQGVTAYHLEAITEKPGGAFAAIGATPSRYAAESLPRLYAALKDMGVPLQPGEAPPESLAVPDSPLMADMGRLVEGLRPLPLDQRIDGVMELLRKRCTYSMQIRNPGKFPALQNFLYGEREGMCIHFATAGALLLRLADVPARVAFGLSGGEYYADEDVFAFRGTDAHVWVEVMLRDHGWTVVEPTPDGQGAARAPTPTSAPADYLAKISGTDAANENGEIAGDTPASALLRAMQHLPWGMITVAMLACIFVGAFLVSWKQRAGATAARGDVVHIPALADESPRYLREFYRICQQRFGMRKAPSETLLEFVSGLKRAGAVHDEFDALCDYHYSVHYRGTPRDAAREAKLREATRSFISSRDKA